VELGQGDFTDPVAFPSGVAVARYAGALVAFDCDSGKKLWIATLPKGLSTPPVLGPDAVLRGTGDGGVLYAVSLQGKVLSAATFSGKPTSTSQPAIGPDGTLYIASDDGKLRALDARGRVRWEAALGGHVPPRSDTAPLLAGDSVYVATATTLEAFSLDGARRWKQSCGACSAPILRGPDGTLYAGRYGAQAFAPDGTFLWAVDAPDEDDRWSPGVLTDEGLLIWTDAQGLRALIAGAATPAEQASGSSDPAASTRRTTAR
jgi:eukaryotic-like serine/threonine-protein kinase